MSDTQMARWNEAHSSATVLVVDDEPGVRMVAAAMLERAGYRVLQSGSGREALTILQKEQVDAVLTDVQMPGMDGLALVGEIRRANPGFAMVLMSGFLTEEITAQTELPVVSKPFTPQVLSSAVRSALARAAHGERHVA